MRVRRVVFLVLGIINVALGAAGIVLPLLPTTPFLILAAYLFAKSDERRYRWLMEHRHLGPYVHAFRSKTGLTRNQKIRIGTSISVVMIISIYFAPILLVKCMLAGGWVFWTIVLIRMKTAAPSTSA